MKRCFLLLGIAIMLASCSKETTCNVSLNFTEDNGHDVSKIVAIQGTNKKILFKNLATSIQVSFIDDVATHIRIANETMELRGCVELTSSDCGRIVNVGWDKYYNLGRLY